MTDPCSQNRRAGRGSASSERVRWGTIRCMSEGDTNNGDYRMEHDSMGEVRVPARALWRAQTQRAVENFPISGVTIDRQLIGALASIKGAAARVNGELGIVDGDMATAIHDAAAEVARGEHDAHFPIDVFQTG